MLSPIQLSVVMIAASSLVHAQSVFVTNITIDTPVYTKSNTSVFISWHTEEVPSNATDTTHTVPFASLTIYNANRPNQGSDDRGFDFGDERMISPNMSTATGTLSFAFPPDIPFITSPWPLPGVFFVGFTDVETGGEVSFAGYNSPNFTVDALGPNASATHSSAGSGSTTTTSTHSHNTATRMSLGSFALPFASITPILLQLAGLCLGF